MNHVADDTQPHLVPVLEVGGTHVTAAWAGDDGHVEVVDTRPLDNAAPADDIVAVLVASGRTLDAPAGTVWGAAVPGPFDYEGGIGDYTGVEKFWSLRGFDLGAVLRAGLAAARVHFINDADAFGVGEAMAGGLQGRRRGVGITLGTGIGSAFVADGMPITSGDEVPRLGEIHTAKLDGVPVEQLFSRVAIREAHRDRTGEWLEVKDIADLARQGDPVAVDVLDQAYASLARALVPVLQRFGAEALVVGGSISKSSDLLARFFTCRLDGAGPDGGPIPVALADDPARSALVGVAHWVRVREAQITAT
ncbi:ROK family protein [Propionibacteriaceae bacterium G1746]|uniref:ROK family protein n=1 Tax=Aestuariimicrobium sp. G57 TaxID=3418485 RepID=UPI003C16CB10